MPLPAKLRQPGWYRAALFDVLGFGFAFGLTVLVRWLMHEHPVIDGNAITIVALIAVPLFFLVGLGTADYWFYWAAGKRTRARGPFLARRPHLAGLLPRQHRPQGDRDPVRRHVVLLLPGRRSAGDADARRARAAGDAVRHAGGVQRAVLDARDAADLPVRRPRVRRARELRAAADDRRAGHGFPAAQRAVVLAAADGGNHDADELPGPWRLIRGRLDGVRAAVDDDAARTAVLHHRRCSSQARHRSPLRSTSS